MILDVLVKNQKATKKRKAFQYIGTDEDIDEEGISSVDKEKKVASGSGSTQTTINWLLKKNLKEEACQQIARFFYTSAIQFNYVKNPAFVKALELITNHGPSYHDIREKYLKHEVNHTMK